MNESRSKLYPYVAGDRVFLPGGKRGTVKGMPDMNNVTVELDGDGGTLRFPLNELALIPAAA